MGKNGVCGRNIKVEGTINTILVRSGIAKVRVEIVPGIGADRMDWKG